MAEVEVGAGVDMEEEDVMEVVIERISAVEEEIEMITEVEEVTEDRTMITETKVVIDTIATTGGRVRYICLIICL